MKLPKIFHEFVDSEMKYATNAVMYFDANLNYDATNFFIGYTNGIADIANWIQSLNFPIEITKKKIWAYIDGVKQMRDNIDFLGNVYKIDYDVYTDGKVTAKEVVINKLKKMNLI